MSKVSVYNMKGVAIGDIELNDQNWAEFCRNAEQKGLPEMIAIWQKYIR